MVDEVNGEMLGEAHDVDQLVDLALLIGGVAPQGYHREHDVNHISDLFDSKIDITF